MQCPFCRHEESRVVDSRLAAAGTVTWRRRECEGCKRRFTTYERVEYALPAVVKKDGQRVPFDRDKLLRSFRVACNKRPVPTERLESEVDAIERELGERGEREVTTLWLGERVMERLRDIDAVAFLRFASVYKSFGDPDEFMREVAELLRGPRRGPG